VRRAPIWERLQAAYLGRLSGRGSTLPLEKLLALQPDLVLDSRTSTPPMSLPPSAWRARRAWPACWCKAACPEHARQLREVGALLGAAGRAETLARHADEARLWCAP
jgi:iron complex transport system substrate-binding protein